MWMSRRNLLFLGAAAVGYAAFSGGRALWPSPGLRFTPVAQPAGFRRIAGQGVSAGNVGLVGIGQGVSAPALMSAQELCGVAFQGGAMEAGRLTIASFSDFFCPYCRVLDRQLHDIVSKMPEVDTVWHQVPLLGRPSQMAARGALAAMEQDAFAAYQARLTRTSFVPTPSYMRAFAEENALDAARFVAVMNAPETNQQLALSAAAFRAFGFIGTPGLVVGRTLVVGVISPRDLRKLIDLELASDAPAACH
jgi:protein-disulfide isomerase